MTTGWNSRAADWIRINARRFPDRRCFVTTDGSYTFGEVNSRVNRVATALRLMGVGKGDRVALFATDSPQYVETLLACMKLGAIYVPLNFRLTLRELQVLLGAAEPKVLFYSLRYAELVSAVDVAGLSALVCYEGGHDDTGYETLANGGVDEEIDVPVFDSDIMCLAFTSGTTALPKGVLHSQRMTKHLTTQCVIERRMTSTDFHYSAAPLFHVGGMLYALAGVARGHTSLILPAFEPAAVAGWMSDGGLDAVFLVPSMIDTLLAEPAVRDGDFSRLRSIGYGAAPMSPDLLTRAMARFGCDFMNMFGAGTEAGLQTVLTPEDHRAALAGQPHLLGSIGKPGMGVDLRLCDRDLREVPPGEVGEIVTRSDAVMSGYLNQPEETAKVLVDGWFRGGDLAWQDEQGYLYLSGRRNDMIIRGGENIYPVEIESVLTEHPLVREAAVVGIPDAHWGETVCAYVTAEGASMDVAELRAHCRRSLAGYKVPERFELVPDLPRNASGKVLKRRLREQSTKYAERLVGPETG